MVFEALVYPVESCMVPTLGALAGLRKTRLEGPETSLRKADDGMLVTLPIMKQAPNVVVLDGK